MREVEENQESEVSWKPREQTACFKERGLMHQRIEHERDCIPHQENVTGNFDKNIHGELPMEGSQISVHQNGNTLSPLNGT